MGEVSDTLLRGGGGKGQRERKKEGKKNIIFAEASQASFVRPSDEGSFESEDVRMTGITALR
jgi:hypothetical protein